MTIISKKMFNFVAIKVKYKSILRKTRFLFNNVYRTHIQRKKTIRLD